MIRYTYIALFFCLVNIAACGKSDSVGCTTIQGSPVNRPAPRCNVGEVLVGYDPNGIGGPLLCATQTTTCPVPAK